MPSFVTVAEISEILPGTMKEVDVDGQSVVVANVDGHFFAVEAVCTHRGGPLGEGELEGETLTCPWHHGSFNVTTGQPVSLPPTEPVETYRVRVAGTSIQVATD